MILDSPNKFGPSTNSFGRVQKQYGPYQNNLYPSKTIWMVRNYIGHIEGQGIKVWILVTIFLYFNLKQKIIKIRIGIRMTSCKPLFESISYNIEIPLYVNLFFAFFPCMFN